MIPINENDMVVMIRIGQFFTNKWRRRVAKSDQLTVLRQMRKQGIPAEIAVAMLCTKQTLTQEQA